MQADVPRRARRSKTLGTPTAYIGKKKGLVILVSFKDVQFSSVGRQEEFNNMFNRSGYSSFNHIGSVHDYFADQSYGRFDLTFDVIGPVTLSNDVAYYGSNRIDTDSDRRPGEMVAEACKAIDKKVNYADYDWDGDGEVDQVFIVYAGYGEHAGAPTYTIWPHESELGSRAAAGDGDGVLTLDGVRIDTYACSCELSGVSGLYLNGIGTACHEFSHCLGLPDFYDVSYTGGFGMGEWDLMSSGSHNGPYRRGEVPCGFTAYERWFAGWLDLSVISRSCRISEMPNLGGHPVAYVVRNAYCSDEYFILENHQSHRWYSWAGSTTDCHGLMVTHVDYDPTSWSRNRVNNNNQHQRMGFVPADADYGTRASRTYAPTSDDLRGDLFPGSKQVTTLARTSHQNVGGLYFQSPTGTSTPLGFVLTDITDADDVVSFCVLFGDDLPAPVVSEASAVSSSSFTANWERVPQADAYMLELVRVVSQKPLRTVSEFYQHIPTASYTFSGLTEGNYRYRVRSEHGDLVSEWSNYVSVRLVGDGIAPLFWTEQVTSPDACYDLSGRPIPTSRQRQRSIFLQRHADGFHKVIR